MNIFTKIRKLFTSPTNRSSALDTRQANAPRYQVRRLRKVGWTTDLFVAVDRLLLTHGQPTVICAPKRTWAEAAALASLENNREKARRVMVAGLREGSFVE